ncbi:S-layer homology domain-containing protein [Phosphitispora fastidiosa]|uniref:S-layer homology domain-containing protein n=1 Tax=Phosphitispora fastidiosa TaxID=2837202 RepID=UPI001E2FD564
MTSLFLIMIPLVCSAESQEASLWVQEAVQGMRENNLADEQVFNNYQKNITRAEFCMMAIRMTEKVKGTVTIQNGEDVFSDIAENRYQDDIIKAYRLGVVSGVGNGKFAPDAEITREQIAVMVLKTIQAIYPEENYTASFDRTFVDYEEISNWARNAIKYSYENNIMSGVKPNEIGPQQKATSENCCRQNKCGGRQRVGPGSRMKARTMWFALISPGWTALTPVMGL